MSDIPPGAPQFKALWPTTLMQVMLPGAPDGHPAVVRAFRAL